MELLSFLLMVLVPLGFLAWSFTKRGMLSAIATPFLVMLFFSVMALNTDPVLTWQTSQLGCPSVPLNSTSTVSGNTTTTVNTPAPCVYVPGEERHELDPTALLVVTYTAMIGEMVLAFIVLLRVKEGLKKRKQLKESEQ